MEALVALLPLLGIASVKLLVVGTRSGSAMAPGSIQLGLEVFRGSAKTLVLGLDLSDG